ncbi:alpha/beta fold hydrolase [Segnochrobactraceae bacterium EtOH-i3]
MPLVFLHGIGSAARSFAGVLPLVSARRQAVAWDAPGYQGSAPLGCREPDAGSYALVLERMLEAVGIPRIHLVGHSLGAIMAARFAADYPDRVASLTLASVALGHARLEPARRAELLANRLADLDTFGPRGLAEKRGPRLCGPHASPKAIRAVIDTMAMVTPVGYRDAARLLAGADTLADVARLPADLPMQVVWGAEDVVTPPAANRKVVDARPGCGAVEIARLGHAFYVEQPAALADALECFLQDQP